ncbi:MAG: hypothetical protein JW969_11905 [Spirochaetales bacterium]|nr:hypothetical protein [Spirochaetales bacterium]
MKALYGILFFLVCLPVLYAQEESPTEAARKKFEEVESLYASGQYEDCRKLVEVYLQATGDDRFPNYFLARLYRIKGFLVYAFREEGKPYRDEIQGLFQKAIELDINLTPGKPSQIPPFLYDLFTSTRDAYIKRFTRETRRNNIGLYSTVFINLGLYYSINLSDSWSITAEIGFPFRSPFIEEPAILDKLSGQIGAVWYPTWNLEQIIFALAGFYRFELNGIMVNDLKYIHTMSIAGQAEINTRLGLGIFVRAEIIRIDLYYSGGSTFELPAYGEWPILPGFLRIGYANINFGLFYTF